MIPALVPACAAFGCAAVAASAVWRGVNVPASQVLAPSVHRVPQAGRRIALTFDDGPSESTPELLALLAEHDVKATFFMCGANVERLPEVARAIVAAGHELGNHTQTHMRMCPRIGWKLNLRMPAAVEQELAQAQLSIQQHTGVWPTLFRAPYGLRWFGLRGAQRRLGLEGVMWSVIAHDWEWPAERVAEHLLLQTEPGGIVCMHDGRDTRPQPDIRETLRALRIVLPAWRERGYAVGTVGALVAAGSRPVGVAARLRWQAAA